MVLAKKTSYFKKGDRAFFSIDVTAWFDFSNGYLRVKQYAF